jgi:polyisoprenoid-binding protein YceI
LSCQSPPAPPFRRAPGASTRPIRTETTRDAQLRSEEIFHAGAHPQLRFESTEIRPLGDDAFQIHGELTMRGTTRPVVLEAEVKGTETDPWSNERVGLEVAGQLDRRDWDMAFKPASLNRIVSDKVKLRLDISAVKQA